MADIGRGLVVKQGVTAIAGVRTKTVTINSEPVDITSDDSSGFRTMLDDVGQQSIDLSVEGVTENSTIRAAMLGGGSQLLTDITVAWPDGGTVAGDFYMNSYVETGTYNDAVTFTASLQSSGTWTYTPPV